MRLENDFLCRLSIDDSIAFTELVDNYYVPINSFVLRLTHSELLAQEIVQDLFIKIWINRKSLASVDNLPAYLFVTARNHSLNVLKREALGKKANSIFCSEIIASYQQQEPESYVCRKEILDRFVNRLPSQQRQVYMLCYQNGLKYRM